MTRILCSPRSPSPSPACRRRFRPGRKPGWPASTTPSSPPSAPTCPPGKVEVMEVFSYGCPACNHFLPTMKKLKAALPAERAAGLPAGVVEQGGELAAVPARLSHGAVAGRRRKAHEAMFQAIWTTGELGVTEAVRPRQDQAAVHRRHRAFYQRVTGVKAADFVSASKSFSVDLKMRQADSQIIAMQVPSTPTLVVNGKYRMNNENLTHRRDDRAGEVPGGQGKRGEAAQPRRPAAAPAKKPLSADQAARGGVSTAAARPTPAAPAPTSTPLASAMRLWIGFTTM